MPSDRLLASLFYTSFFILFLAGGKIAWPLPQSKQQKQQQHQEEDKNTGDKEGAKVLCLANNYSRQKTVQ